MSVQVQSIRGILMLRVPNLESPGLLCIISISHLLSSIHEILPCMLSQLHMYKANSSQLIAS